LLPKFRVNEEDFSDDRDKKSLDHSVPDFDRKFRTLEKRNGAAPAAVGAVSGFRETRRRLFF
jgi:hypothetical protein